MDDFLPHIEFEGNDMGDYTKLSKELSQEILNLYFDEEVLELSALSLGISNSNYSLITKKNHYLLKVSNDKNADEVKAEMVLLDKLSELEFPYSLTPFHTKNEELVYQHGEFFGVLFPFLDGIPPGPSDQTCYEVGKGLGLLHSLKVEKGSIRDHGDVGFDTEDIIDYANDENCPQDFSEVVKQYFPKGMKSYVANVPEGVTHGDLYYDNTLFKNEKLQALLDFEQGGWGDQLLDLGISLSGTCLEKGRIHPELIKSYLAGYYEKSTYMRFTEEEINKSIILGLLSIALWRIERFNIKKINPHMVDSYKELIRKIHIFAQTKGI